MTQPHNPNLHSDFDPDAEILKDITEPLTDSEDEEEEARSPKWDARCTEMMTSIGASIRDMAEGALRSAALEG